MGARINFQVGQLGHTDSKLSFVRDLPSERNSSGRSVRYVEVLCVCGSVKEISVGNWRGVAARVLTCGCDQFSGHRRTHGLSDTPIHQRWKDMKQRTTVGSIARQRNPNYNHVQRDSRWDSFESFYEDMGETYFDGAVLARYGDSGDYTKDNCRWITKSENSKEMNRLSGKMHLTSDGRFVADVSVENGIPSQTANERIWSGWSPDEAATVPVGGKR